jgi:hypothetical protein
MDEVQWYVSLIVSWLPFLVMIGSGIWIGRTVSAGLQTTDGRSVAQVVDDYARELRRSSDLLAEMLKRHQQQLEALEQKGAP